MKTFNLLILIFFILMMIKLSFQLEFILIRLKHFHKGKTGTDKTTLKTLKSIDHHLEMIAKKIGAEESIEDQKESEEETQSPESIENNPS